MSTNVTVNNAPYSIPNATGETGWGTSLTSWIQAVSNSTLQKSGGTFTLTADIDFGAAYGVKSAYFSTRSSNPSTSGIVRLANAESVGWKNAASSGNLLLTVNASDQLTYNGIVLSGSSALTASRAMVTDASGYASASSVTSTELGRLSGITSTAVGISDSQTLTNKTLTSPAVTGLTGTLSSPTITTPTVVTPTIQSVSTPSTPASGYGKVYFKSDGFLYQLNDSGTETKVGAGSGGINYISNPDSESGTTGWATYRNISVPTATTPETGTGGTSTITLTRTTSSPLRGTGSFLITKDAVSRVGDGVSYAFTIDAADEAKVLNVSFDYSVSANFVSGDSSDIRVWIYDVTNAVLIPVTPYTIQGGTGNQFKFSGVFQTASNSLSYRLILHVATTNALATTFKFDNVVVGPQIQLYGAPIGDWTAYTPTGAWNTNTTYTGFWRRVGDSMHVSAKVALSGAPNAATATFLLPTGHTIDTAKTGYVTSSAAIGSGISKSNGDLFTTNVLYNTTTSVVCYALTLSAAGTHQSSPVTATAPATFTNGDYITVDFVVPIAGWSSTVLMSNDTDTRVVALRVSGDPASASSGNPVIFPTAAYDTHSVYNASTGRYTAPVSGIYNVFGAIVSANAAVDIYIYVDAAQVIYAGTTDSNGEGQYLGSVKVTAGQVIDIRPGATLDAGSGSTLHIERLSGPSAIAATESVNVRGYRTSTQAISTGTDTDVVWPSASWDSHGALNTSTGIFTAPTSGKYSYKVALEFEANTTGQRFVKILQNTAGGAYSVTEFNQIRASDSGQTSVIASGTLKLLAGDGVKFQGRQNSGGSLNVWVTTGATYFNIDRIGN